MYVFDEVFLCVRFLQVSTWKYCWWKRGKKQTKPRNARGAMNQTATSLLGTKRFSWPKLKRPSSWAVTATGLQAHLDLAPLWTQLLHFHHFRALTPKLPKANGCACGAGVGVVLRSVAWRSRQLALPGTHRPASRFKTLLRTRIILIFKSLGFCHF